MITDEIFNTCHFPESSHFHGNGIFGNTYRCIEHPRLQVKVLCTRKTRTAEHSYLVDGKPHATKEAAIAALNVPVVITPEEQAILDSVPTEWTRAEIGERGDAVARMFGLTCKGLVEWQAGSYRRRVQP